MKKTVRKQILRTIRQTLNRFLAIFAITVLGVGFLTGLLCTAPDMKRSVDRYYDAQNFMDIDIKSTMGLTERDREAVAALPGVRAVTPLYQIEKVVSDDTGEMRTVRFSAIDLNALTGEDANLPILVDGRYPQAANECVEVLIGPFAGTGKTGDVMWLAEEETEQSGDEETETDVADEDDSVEDEDDGKDTEAAFTEKRFTVVGQVTVPLVMSTERDMTSVGSGSVSAYYYVLPETVDTDVYTDFYVTLTDAAAMDTFSDAYQDWVDERTDRLEDLGKEREKARYEELRQEADDKIAEAESEYESGRAEAESELEDARKELVDAADEIADGEEELADGRKELDDAAQELADSGKELREAKEELEDARKKLDDAEPDVKKARKAIEENEPLIQRAKKSVAEYDRGMQEYDDGMAQLQTSKDQLEKGEEQYRTGMETFSGQKAAALEKLEKAESDLTSGEEALAAAKGQWEEQKASWENSAADAEDARAQAEALREKESSGMELSDEERAALAALEQAAAEWDAAGAALDAGEEELAKQSEVLKSARGLFEEQEKAAKAELEKGEKELAAARAELDAGWKEYKIGEEKLAGAWAKLDEASPRIEEAREAIREWNKLYPQLKAAIESYEDGKAQYREGREAYESGREKWESGSREAESGEAEYEENRQKLIDAKQELSEGESEYESASAEAESEFADAEEKLADARKKRDDIEYPEWYVLDRNTNPTYVSFVGNADKVTAISKVFPIFFFLVAALVALTTMTRMVEEERTEIGTMKALGYRNRTIAAKYLIYAGLAGVLGSAAGILLGQWVFPTIIWNAYGIMYYFPGFRVEFLPQYAFPSALAATVSVLAATWWAVTDTLREKPALLMLPKAPKAGKRIFLESVVPVWSRMKFTWKVTARNLFRYKKRFFMTIIGIAGCTALLVTGFGIRDSIGHIVELQFADIQQYDLTVGVEDDISGEERGALETYFTDAGEPFLAVHQESGEIIAGKKREKVILERPSDEGGFAAFVDLRTRTTGEKVPFDKNSVVLTEKLASTLGVGIGDTVTLENADDLQAERVVTGITENYIRGYAYLGTDVWPEDFDQDSDTYLIRTQTGDETGAKELRLTEILAFDGVASAQFSGTVIETFSNMLNKIDYIVVVLIICAGLLAFVVLYNLTNINISERQKEIATIKVLGFYHSEVNAYIYRETLMLSLFGIALGLVLGVFLHRFVILTVEVSEIMFGRRILPLSYVWSALITLLFTMLVCLVMSRRLRRISMVESLKSVD